MILGTESDKYVRNVKWFEKDPNKEKILKYIQGAVYCWCKNFGDKAFAACDLFGGVNNNWNGTPLQALYDYQKKHNQQNLLEKDLKHKAGIELGWIMKKNIKVDDRRFSTYKTSQRRYYIWEK